MSNDIGHFHWWRVAVAVGGTAAVVTATGFTILVLSGAIG
jgi:hypothetical protein